ncbi:hypothetical protein RFI_09651 [Reticulomyxa filosa]|uniref:Alpha-L-rhamnosidase six-hairpin glycosidase domain-containing protein n=1 Tax=Reticulomyxa filosa TaxID=46433 RepID=X6NNB7_RETFI|nr:hypothetical protein RFI_09651 [Reticulomyxa filosa]|eukprot:ETO27481.1 hypothetical protein RFI_09651 [Reticulomyxa filosa]
MYYIIIIIIYSPKNSEDYGSVPDVVPFYRYGSRPSDPSWGLAFPQTVSALNQYFNLYGVMQSYMNDHTLLNYLTNLQNRMPPKNDIKQYPASYGDWVMYIYMYICIYVYMYIDQFIQNIDNPFTGAFSYIEAVRIVSSFAEEMDNLTLVSELNSLYSNLKGLFLNAWFNNQTNNFDVGIQTSYALPLHAHIYDPARLAQIENNLLTQISTDHNLLTVGILGCKFLFPVLSTLTIGDHTSLALSMIVGGDNFTYPSYSYESFNTYEPATGLWELWDAPSEGPGMNSRNHHMFSSVSGYLHSYVAGLVVADRGHKHLSKVQGGPRQMYYRVRIGHIPSQVLQWSELQLDDIFYRWEWSSSTNTNTRLQFQLHVPVGVHAVLEVAHPCTEYLFKDRAGGVYSSSSSIDNAQNKLFLSTYQTVVGKHGWLVVGSGIYHWDFFGRTKKKKKIIYILIEFQIFQIQVLFFFLSCKLYITTTSFSIHTNTLNNFWLLFLKSFVSHFLKNNLKLIVSIEQLKISNQNFYVVTDLLVLKFWYEEKERVLFWMGVTNLLVVQLCYYVEFLVRYLTTTSCGRHWISFVFMFVISPLLPYVFYLASSPRDKLYHMLKAMGLYRSLYGFSWKNDNETKVGEWVTEKKRQYHGFLLQAILESMPQSVIQMTALLYFNQINSLTLFSLFVSLANVSTNGDVNKITMIGQLWLYKALLSIGPLAIYGAIAFPLFIRKIYLQQSSFDDSIMPRFIIILLASCHCLIAMSLFFLASIMGILLLELPLFTLFAFVFNISYRFHVKFCNNNNNNNNNNFVAIVICFALMFKSEDDDKTLEKVMEFVNESNAKYQYCDILRLTLSLCCYHCCRRHSTNQSCCVCLPQRLMTGRNLQAHKGTTDMSKDLLLEDKLLLEYPKLWTQYFNHKFQDIVLRLAAVNWILSAPTVHNHTKLHTFLSGVLIKDTQQEHEKQRKKELQGDWKDGRNLAWKDLTFAHLSVFTKKAGHSTIATCLKDELMSLLTGSKFFPRDRNERKNITTRWIEGMVNVVFPLYLLQRIISIFFPFACLLYALIVSPNCIHIAVLQLSLTVIYTVIIVLLMVAILPYTFWWFWLSWNVLPGYHFVLFFLLFAIPLQLLLQWGFGLNTGEHREIDKITENAKNVYWLVVATSKKVEVVQDVFGPHIAEIVCLYLPPDLTLQQIQQY